MSRGAYSLLTSTRVPCCVPYPTIPKGLIGLVLLRLLLRDTPGEKDSVVVIIIVDATMTYRIAVRNRMIVMMLVSSSPKHAQTKELLSRRTTPTATEEGVRVRVKGSEHVAPILNGAGKQSPISIKNVFIGTKFQIFGYCLLVLIRNNS
jgi:hypothetical protein